MTKPSPPAAGPVDGQLFAPTLRCELDSTFIELGERVRIGRSRRNGIRLVDVSVSGEHALLEWREDRWELRDLGSRNGSRVDGELVPPGGSLVVGLGSVMEFAQDDRVYLMVDARPPGDDTPRPLDATLFTPTVADPSDLGSARFTFRPSMDEEVVRWSVLLGKTEHDLGSRAHVYLVLTLARIREEEAELPESERGWTYGDDLARRLGMTPETLKVQVYRARRQLQGLIVGAAGIIERRAATNQIRFGVDAIEILRP